MANTLVKAYDRFSDVQNAREALLGSGFDPASVHLNSNEDEAGPVEGNAVNDAKDRGKGPGSSLFRSEQRTDAYNSATPVWRACFVLTVDASDEAQGRLASDIMERYGAVGTQPPPRAH